MGAVLGVLLRNYGFTDLPPSLPLPRSDPVTRISESKRRRGVSRFRFTAPRGPLWSSQKQDRTHGVRKEEKGAQERKRKEHAGLKISIRDTLNNMYVHDETGIV